MKILQINKFFYLRGGSERYFFELAGILEKKGHEVANFSMKHGRNQASLYEKYFAEPVNLDKFSFKNILKIFYNREAGRKLSGLIKDFQPDIAHLHNIDRQLGPAIINLLKKKNIPVIMTLHDYKMFCPKGTLYNKNKYCEKCLGGKFYHCAFETCVKNSRLKSFLAAVEAYWLKYALKSYDQVDLFHAPSHFMKTIAVKSGIPEEKIKELVYPINIADAATDKADKANEPYLLYFGRLSEEKGIETIIQALAGVKANIRLKIAGEGLLHQKLMATAENQNQTQRVDFLGYQSGKDLNKIINGAAIVIVPSLWPDNMPYVLLESLAAGKIVIASRTGGMPERVTEGINGYLFQPGDSLDLAEKINTALESPDNTIMAKSARESVSQFNHQNHYISMLGFYAILLNGNRSRRF